MLIHKRELLKSEPQRGVPEGDCVEVGWQSEKLGP